MVARVATFALSEQMVSAALRTQAKISERQIETASGKVSSDYGGLGATSKKVIDLQVSISQSKSYEDAASSADDRVQAMYSATGSIAELLSSYKSELTGAVSASGTDASTLTSAAEGFMSEMTSLLNTQYGGRYLFAGSRTDMAPVDLSSYSNTTSATAADTSYYTGDDQLASAKVSDSQYVTYGVTASNPAFEKAMRAFSMIANATSSPIDSTTLSSALDLATSALDAVTGVQTKLSLSASQLERAVNNQQTYQSDATTLSDSLTNVDVAAVTAEISTYQAQLEASYSAISKIQSLRLSDYLR
ncbi:flagellin [Pseudolabrys taiwanensis]|uniref:Flagellin n=1 Tax=Pseudolabrys taiwanensis TaxID=331696 RepID=A0A345ZX69_9HYPH|nr:flagellin [Pseudolabrys taiwanensis]AXK81516.1 flagellin [Pseudolabrys taiwanensis]